MPRPVKYPRLVLRKIREKRFYLVLDISVQLPTWQLCVLKSPASRLQSVREANSRDELLPHADRLLAYWKEEERRDGALY